LHPENWDDLPVKSENGKKYLRASQNYENPLLESGNWEGSSSRIQKVEFPALKGIVSRD
jgi:hypothetical protein